MSYSKKFEELRDAARRKAQELDEQFGLRDKLELGLNTASDVARFKMGGIVGKNAGRWTTSSSSRRPLKRSASTVISGSIRE